MPSLLMVARSMFLLLALFGVGLMPPATTVACAEGGDCDPGAEPEELEQLCDPPPFPNWELCSATCRDVEGQGLLTCVYQASCDL
jgi:hypothetical protein